MISDILKGYPPNRKRKIIDSQVPAGRGYVSGGQSKLAIFSVFFCNFFPVSPFPFLPAVFSTFWMLFVPQALLLTNAIFRKGLRPNGASKASVALDGSCATRIHDESLFFVAGTILRDAGG